MGNVIREGEVNIDELSAAEFVTYGKSEDDTEMIDVVEQLGLLKDITVTGCSRVSLESSWTRR